MKLTGTMVQRLMRRHRVTMRDIKAKHHITLKRIREVRANGFFSLLASGQAPGLSKRPDF